MSAYEDLNGNGQRDTGEDLLAGATIHVTDAFGFVRVRVTDGFNEPWCFSDLSPGVYTAAGQPLAGYNLITLPIIIPVSIGAVEQAAFGYQPLPTATATATASATSTLAPTATATATPSTGAISALVFDDRNGDGQRDPSQEPLVADAVIRVTDSGGLAWECTTNGREPCPFYGLEPGDYVVIEQNPPGYQSTTPDVVVARVRANWTIPVQFGDWIAVTPTATPTATSTPQLPHKLYLPRIVR